MKTLAEQLKTYGDYHKNPINKVIHIIGIPCITFSVLLLFSWVYVSVPPYFILNLAWLMVIIISVYYLLLYYKLATPVILVAIVLNLIAQWIAYPGPTKTGMAIFAIFFIGGWALQLLGPVFEGKRPPFTRNLFQMLI